MLGRRTESPKPRVYHPALSAAEISAIYDAK
jgi:hypothetical protein